MLRLDVDEHNGVRYLHTYFALGKDNLKAYHKHLRARFTSKEGPANGWCGVLSYDEGEGAVTLFCPHTFTVIPRDKRDPEITEAIQRTFDPDIMADRIKNKIAECQKLNMSVDYVTAGRFISLLTGEEIPVENLDKKNNRGSAASETLLRPIRPNSQTAKIVEQLLNNPDINLAEKKLRKSRQQLLSALYVLAHTHGFGYSVSRNSVAIELPQDQLTLEDCIRVVPRKKTFSEPKEPPKPDEIKKLKKNSKRAKVLLHLLEHKNIGQCEKAFNLKRNNVFSLLYLLQQDNGVSYETSRNSDQIKITLPCSIEEMWK